MPIPLIDVFAGPGGLNEGFSSLIDAAGEPIFQTVASFELDPWACETLKLRSAVRHYRRIDRVAPSSYYEFLRSGGRGLADLKVHSEMAVGFKEAESEVVCMALGPQTRPESDHIIESALQRHGGKDDWVLIGGPPCQAYSLAGRSRRKGDPTFADDHKHVLYKEYLAILERFRPSVFVMENVKGMLSSKHAGGAIFQSIRDDLSSAGYDLRSFVIPGSDPSPSDFIIRSENYGIPQRRHRVILLGVRHGTTLDSAGVLEEAMAPVTVEQAIGGLPRIRSMVSPRNRDSEVEWRRARDTAWLIAGRSGGRTAPTPDIGAAYLDEPAGDIVGELGDWLLDDRLGGVTLHESRAHMTKDLMRYGYLAQKAVMGERPKLGDLPDELVPNHKNARDVNAPFTDRFRVQVSGQASTTVVSHISKDGHYYIHPDPVQMRSLSVREAARLQTFPDDYFFVGGRTQQYHQVGNAVPPLLARQLGEVVARMFGRKVDTQRL